MPHLPRRGHPAPGEFPLTTARLRWIAAPACALAAGCAAAPPAARADAGREVLAAVRVGDEALRLRAFVVETSFLFPERSDEIVRALLRAEFARREARRLGVAPDPAVVAEQLQEVEQALGADLGEGEDLDAWARRRHGVAWPVVRRVYARHLEDNLRYQMAVRAEAWLHGRVRLQWFVTEDEERARSIRRRLEAGADPRALLRESAVVGPLEDGSFPPVARRLPEPAAAALDGAEAGDLIGPLRFAGDRSWRVARVVEVLPPRDAPPPRAEIVAALEESPVGALEARAWFEEMLRRYTAVAGKLPISGPSASFVPAR